MCLCALTPLGIAWVVGCGGITGNSQNQSRRPTLNLSTLGIGDDATYFEEADNDFLQSADSVEVTSEPRVIRGRVSGADDVDVYDFGAVSAGTRIVVEMTSGQGLDGAIALFDGSGSALLVNDHRNAYLGVKNAFIDVVTKQASDACYVAVTATPGYSADGDYALLASKTSPEPTPSPRPEDVLLVFNGGTGVTIGGRRAVELDTFDASDIDQSFSGRTNELIAAVLTRVRRDYEGFDVTIQSTSEGAQFDGFMTRIYFGSFDPGLLGVADGVDEFNSTPTQNAIIFTDTFEAFSRLNPSVDQMAHALANVTSHEIGHLLGLVHTQDPQGIMDITASLSQLLVEQSFRQSPLYSAVFPIGLQYGEQSLLNAVGGDFVPARQKDLALDLLSKSINTADEPSAREQLRFSSCGLH